MDEVALDAAFERLHPRDAKGRFGKGGIGARAKQFPGGPSKPSSSGQGAVARLVGLRMNLDEKGNPLPGHVDTQIRFQNEAKEYTDEVTPFRPHGTKALHDDIEDEFVIKGRPEKPEKQKWHPARKPPKGTRPRALFTAGGPASGKGFIVEKGYVPHLVPQEEFGHVLVNPDPVKYQLPEMPAMVAEGDLDAASLTHEESSDLAKRIKAKAEMEGLPMLVDGVGNSGGKKFADKIQAAIDAGYEVNVVYATSTISRAKERETIRAQGSGRKVDHEKTLVPSHVSVSARFQDSVVHLKGAHVEIYDTTKDGKPVHVATKEADATGLDQVTVHDARLWEAFLARAEGGD